MEAPNETPRRAPRFKRRPRGEVERVEVTERDAAIVRLVAEYRFLRSSHITSLLLLYGWSEQQTLRRLRALYDIGFLDRPEEQWAYRSASGARPTVYALGDKGARFLTEQNGIAVGRTRWRDKNREVGSRHVEHTLLIADVMLAFERMCKRRGNVRLILPREILTSAAEEVRRARKPFTWQIKAPWEGTQLRLPVVPDKVFGLQFLDEPDGKNRLWFMLEADRGSETIAPENLLNTRKPTLFHKYFAYQATHAQSIQTQRFGFRGFRVLTVTAKGQGRVAGMIDAAKQASGDRQPNFYLATDLATIEAHEDILRVPWKNARGEERILDL